MPWASVEDYAERRGAEYQQLPREAQIAGWEAAEAALEATNDEGYAIATGWKVAREKAAAIKKGK